jgi:hypothetical protein
MIFWRSERYPNRLFSIERMGTLVMSMIGMVKKQG